MRIVLLGDGETWMEIDGAKIYDIEEPFDPDEVKFLVRDDDPAVDMVADLGKLFGGVRDARPSKKYTWRGVV